MIEKKQVFNSLKLIVLFITLFGFVALAGFFIITQKWKQARGYEYEWIAASLASGHGYSFDIGSAWLGPYTSSSGFIPTAWSEPIQIIIMAFAFRMMGENGRLFLVLLNIFWLALTCIVIYRIAKRLLGTLTGYISIFLFFIVLFINAKETIYIGNTALAILLVSLCALALIRVIEVLLAPRVITLGIILGLTNLTHASSLLFSFCAALIILIHRGNLKSAVMRNVGILLGTLLITLSPWIFRNYIVFNRIIPVRNGFGWQLYLGNLGLSAVAGYDLGEGFIDPGFPWHVNNHQAVEIFKSLESEAKVREYLMTATEPQYPEAYASYNEAQRDRFFLHKSLAFIQANPLQSTIFMFWKSFAFFTWDKLTLLITVLAFWGWLIRFRDIRVHIMMFFIIAYSLPYVLSIPLYYRYCFTIQPLIVILAAITIRSILCLTSAGRYFDKLIDSTSSGVVNI